MLTIKQTSFIQHYLTNANGNATKAAEMAGYSKKTAYSIGQENLKKPEIMKAIEEQHEKAQKRFELTFDEKRIMLWEIVKSCTKIKKGVMINPMTAVNAIRELNKMDGDYTAKEIKLSVKEEAYRALDRMGQEDFNKVKKLYDDGLDLVEAVSVVLERPKKIN